MARSHRLSNRYLTGELILASFFGVLIAVSALMTPSTEMLTVFGYEVPVLCGFRSVTGMGCPGCGMTRSFAFMAHLDVVEAFRMNWLGPVLFVAFATQPPYRTYVIVRELLERRLRLPARDVLGEP